MKDKTGLALLVVSQKLFMETIETKLDFFTLSDKMQHCCTVLRLRGFAAGAENRTRDLKFHEPGLLTHCSMANLVPELILSTSPDLGSCVVKIEAGFFTWPKFKSNTATVCSGSCSQSPIESPAVSL